MTKFILTKFNFNNRAINQLPAHDANAASKSAEYSDTAVAGLKLVVGKTGNKRFAFRYTLASGQSRYAPLGSHPAIDVAEARRLALEMRAVVDRGGDPLEQQDRIKAMPSFAEFFLDAYSPYAAQIKRSHRDDISKFMLHLDAKFGKRRLCDISRRDIELHHAAMKASHTPGTANRHLALLSAIFRKAVEWGHVERNPATGIKAFKENNQQQSFLSPEEIARLFQAMKADPNQIAVAALKLLLLTGVRRGEALNARWENINLETRQWWLPDTKSGRGRYATLNDDAVALLTVQPRRASSPWVFPGRDDSKPLNNIRKTLERTLAAAGLSHIRIHDLRHAHASLAVNAGASLYEVQKLLGHASTSVTQRYAHIAQPGLQRASQSVADAVNAAVRKAEMGVEASVAEASAAEGG